MDNPINQCDGCRLGWPVNENGTHIPPEGLVAGFWSGQLIGCTKDRYLPEQPESENDGL